MNNRIIMYPPDALIKFFEYVKTLKPKEMPDYTKCRQIFEAYLKSEGKTRNSKLDFTPAAKTKTAKAKVVIEANESDEETLQTKVDKRTKKENGLIAKPKRGRPARALAEDSDPESENCENATPNGIIAPAKKVAKKTKVRSTKRKSIEPLLAAKKAKLTPKATPPVKKNHANTATQTSAQKTRKSPRQVSFESPVCEIIGEKKSPKASNGGLNSSRDIFEDSMEIAKPKRRLIADEVLTVKRVTKKKTTTVKAKTKSWKDAATIVNGRPTPS